jgi:hypothetical protein
MFRKESDESGGVWDFGTVRQMIPSGSGDTLTDRSRSFSLAHSNSNDTIQDRSLRRSDTDISEYYWPFKRASRVMKDVVDPVFEEMDQSSTSLASLRAAFRECEEDSPGIVSEILKSMSDRM